MHHALRRPRGIFWIAAWQVVLLGITAVLLAGSPAAAAPLAGTVLTSTTATLPAELAPLATGKRIAYVTTSVTGGTIAATGLVLTPKTNKKNKTVVWGHGTTGLADQCTPSASQRPYGLRAARRSLTAAFSSKPRSGSTAII